MDVKSLAKSKRAHTQHHNKKHHPKPKAPASGSTGATGPSKQQGKQIKEKSSQSQSSTAVSSNWDRYEEDEELDNDTSQSNSSQPSDVVVRKSKGADFSYLISEAKSHSYVASSSLSFPSFDDIFDDYNQGLGPLVSVRGQSILSRAQDDNFLVEDQATSNLEASFLSLDLNSLTKQLAKVDISQRLFIEGEDLLLHELSTTSTTTVLMDHDAVMKITLPDSTTETGTDATTTKTKTGPTAESNIHSVGNPNKSSKFEAVAAEAELDMLLDSFNETSFLDSSVPVSIDQMVSTTLNSQDSSKSALSSNLDSTIDDLLNETSSLVHKGCSHPVTEGPDLLNPIVGSNLDDTIDDILIGTSYTGLVNKKDTDGFANPSKSELFDDFDSWLDTI